MFIIISSRNLIIHDCTCIIIGIGRMNVSYVLRVRVLYQRMEYYYCLYCNNSNDMGGQEILYSMYTPASQSQSVWNTGFLARDLNDISRIGENNY